jgi:hypothetical protein
MGTCESVDGVTMPQPSPGNPGGWDINACFAAGGHKYSSVATGVKFNPNTTAGAAAASKANAAAAAAASKADAAVAAAAAAARPKCGEFTLCNGVKVPSTSIDGKLCGPGNIEFLCLNTGSGSEWRDTGLPCDEGAQGMCMTSCGKMTTCDGTVIAKSKIGAKECGDKGLTYLCANDGKWVIGGADSKETCNCMTICPDMRGCDGSQASKLKVGAEICGLDRKMHICVGNMTAPPEWTYGKSCVCPGDAPSGGSSGGASTGSNSSDVGADSSASSDGKPPAELDTTMVAGLVFGLLFIMIMIVVLVFVMRRKKTGSSEASSMDGSVGSSLSIYDRNSPIASALTSP